MRRFRDLVDKLLDALDDAATQILVWLVWLVRVRVVMVYRWLLDKRPGAVVWRFSDLVRDLLERSGNLVLRLVERGGDALLDRRLVGGWRKRGGARCGRASRERGAGGSARASRA
jgi:hypothetical protein